MTKSNPKVTICLWYDHTAEEAAKFYAKTFPDSRVSSVVRASGDYPDGKEGDALAGPDRAAAKRAFQAMMGMGKIDIAAIEAARLGR